MSDENLAGNVRAEVLILNKAIKAAVAAGLIVRIDELPKTSRIDETPGQAQMQQFTASVMRPL